MYEGGIDDYLLLALGEQVGKVAEMAVAAPHTVPSSIVDIEVASYSFINRTSVFKKKSKIFNCNGN